MFCPNLRKNDFGFSFELWFCSVKGCRHTPFLDKFGSQELLCTRDAKWNLCQAMLNMVSWSMNLSSNMGCSHPSTVIFILWPSIKPFCFPFAEFYAGKADATNIGHQCSGFEISEVPNICTTRPESSLAKTNDSVSLCVVAIFSETCRSDLVQLSLTIQWGCPSLSGNKNTYKSFSKRQNNMSTENYPSQYPRNLRNLLELARD